jgi:type I restriction enzyme, S subunit
VSTLTLIGAHRAVSSLLETRPDSWGVVRFKGLFDRLDQRNTDLSYEMLSLRSTGEVVARAEMGGRQEPDETNLPKYLVAEVDDLVVNPMWLIGGGIGVSERAGAVSPDYRVFRSRGSLLPRFIHYLLRSRPYLDQYLLYTRAQTTFDRRVQQPDLDNLPFPVPPLDEQRAIVGYLNRETARIDTLIEEQQRLIEMLRERRDSVWAAHVEEARRLGQTLSVRRVIESIVDGPFGSSLTSAHYSDEGARVIRLGNIGVNEFKDGDAAFIPFEYAEELEAHAVEQGDVVVAGLGDDKMPLGRAAVVPALGPTIVKADCYRLRPNEQVSAAYLAWVMSAPQTRSQIMLLARGSTRARLNTKVVQQVEVPLPDKATQDALVAQSDAETVKIDRLIAESQRFVELSRERRAALITAAVTGQIDVREMI